MDDFAIEAYLAASSVGNLSHDNIPVNVGPAAIVDDAVRFLGRGVGGRFAYP